MELYEKYHRSRKKQRVVINRHNFTYYNIIKVLEEIEIANSNYKRILDVGCGVGTIDFYLAKKYNKKVTGIDISKKAIEVAISNSENLGMDKLTNFSVSNFPKGPIKGKYDVVILSEVLEHLANERGALVEIRKLINNDGILIVSVPSINAPLYKLGLLKSFDKEVGHLRRYSVRSLSTLLNDNFDIIHVKRTEGVVRNALFTINFLGQFLRLVKGPVSEVVSYIDKISLKVFGESQIFMVATKK